MSAPSDLSTISRKIHGQQGRPNIRLGGKHASTNRRHTHHSATIRRRRHTQHTPHRRHPPTDEQRNPSTIHALSHPTPKNLSRTILQDARKRIGPAQDTTLARVIRPPQQSTTQRTFDTSLTRALVKRTALIQTSKRSVPGETRCPAFAGARPLAAYCPLRPLQLARWLVSLRPYPFSERPDA